MSTEFICFKKENILTPILQIDNKQELRGVFLKTYSANSVRQDTHGDVFIETIRQLSKVNVR